MVHDVEHLDSKLYVKILRDSLDAIVLEHGEIQTLDSWTDYDVPAGIATKVETLQRSRINGSSQARRCRIAVRVPKGRIGCGGDGEALRFNVIVGVSGVCKRPAPGAAKTVREGPIVIAQGIGGIGTRPPCWGKGHAVTHRQDQPQFPAIGDPAARPGE